MVDLLQPPPDAVVEAAEDALRAAARISTVLELWAGGDAMAGVARMLHANARTLFLDADEILVCLTGRRVTDETLLKLPLTTAERTACATTPAV